MSGNRGARNGFRPPGWRDFAPRIDCWPNVGLGAGTPPVLGTAGTVQSGRYLYVPDERRCTYSFDLRWGTSGNAAGGGTQNALAGNYLIELPVPAKNFDGPQTYPGSSTGDRPLGQGMILQGVSNVPQYPGIPVLFTNSDVPSATFGGPRTRWAQMFVPQVIASGSSSIAGTSQAVSFPFTLNYAPALSELQVMFTSSYQPGSGTQAWWVSGASTSGFTVNLNKTPAVAAAFAWTLTAYKSTLVNAQAPFNLGATSGDAIRGLLTYETAT